MVLLVLLWLGRRLWWQRSLLGSASHGMSDLFYYLASESELV